MRALIQRVTEAQVVIDGNTVAAIGPGLLVLLAIQQGDDERRGDSMAERLVAYRIFADEQDRMNRDVRAAGGGILLVSQFTLAADTTRGLRPSLSSAAAPALAERLYDYVVERLRQLHSPVQTGRFAARMQVGLINDGPASFLLET